MGAVHTLKCKFKEVSDSGSLIFYYGYMEGWLFGLIGRSYGREANFTEEDCREMISGGRPTSDNDIVKYNAEESRKALAALADYKRNRGI